MVSDSISRGTDRIACLDRRQANVRDFAAQAEIESQAELTKDARIEASRSRAVRPGAVPNPAIRLAGTTQNLAQAMLGELERDFATAPTRSSSPNRVANVDRRHSGRSAG
jgi:hypothetical protein